LVRYQDIIDDVNKKIFLLEKWNSVYKLTAHYEDYLNACYGHDVGSFIRNMSSYAEDLVSTSHIVYDLSCIPGLTEFLRLWNSFDLKGTYIYRATTTDYIEDYVMSSTSFMVVNSENREENEFLSYWSISPYTSNYFVDVYIGFHNIEFDKVRVLVAPYNDNICSKDWYDNFTFEYTVVINNKPYNFGDMHYLRELEVRCFKYPISDIIYSLTVDEFRELMKYLPKKYVYLK